MIALNDGISISMLSRQEISNSTVGGIDSNQTVGGLNTNPSVGIDYNSSYIRTNKRELLLERLMSIHSTVLGSNLINSGTVMPAGSGNAGLYSDNVGV